MSEEQAVIESSILNDWGVYIRNERRPGPGEKQDPTTGEWGTKPQALGNMVASSRDEEDDPRETVQDVDRCGHVLEFIRTMEAKHIAILFGYYCEYPDSIDICMMNVAENPLTNAHVKYKKNYDGIPEADAVVRDRQDRARFVSTLNKAISLVERRFGKLSG